MGEKGQAVAGTGTQAGNLQTVMGQDDAHVDYIADPTKQNAGANITGGPPSSSGTGGSHPPPGTSA